MEVSDLFRAQAPVKFLLILMGSIGFVDGLYVLLLLLLFFTLRKLVTFVAESAIRCD
jgi:hypothetical protein